MHVKRLILSALLASAVPAISSAAPLFEDNFDVNSAADWTVNSGPGNNPVEFFFDYSTVGIPAAPGSGGTTRGLKLQANVGSATFGGVSVSPTGRAFTGDYTLEYDVWQNYNGPLPAGGNGSTQVTGGGIGTAGTSAQWAGGTHDAVHFGTTGDGGSNIDYRAYPKGSVMLPETNAYAAGNTLTPIDARNSSHPYYAAFGAKTAPAAQLLAYSGQTGVTAVGTQGFAWHHVEITKAGNTVTYTIDDTLIATVDISNITLGGDNILLNYYDVNGTSSTDANAGALLFGLIDNVQVNVVPEPAAATIVALASIGLLRRRR